MGGTARGNGSGLERSPALIWRQLTPTVRFSISAKGIKSAFRQKTIPHILIANMMNVLVIAVP